MAKIFTSRDDEALIRTVLSKGLRADPQEPKWKVLRLAVALSLRQPEPPVEDFDDFRPKDGEYALAQLCGEGQEADYTDVFRVLLSTFHGEDCFADESLFVRLLQRHVRRGLAEMGHGWGVGHDFHEFLFQELFSKASPHDDAPVEDISATLASALRELDIRAEVRGLADGPRLQSYETYLADAGQLRALQRKTEEIGFALGRGPVTLSVGSEPRRVDILVPKPRSTWRAVSWAAISEAIPKSDEARLGVVLGVDPLGQPVTFDLAVAPHLLVGGTTGSGKSVCLQALLCSLLVRHTPSSLQLCLIDPKRTELAAYAGLPNLWDGSPIQDVVLATDTLNDVADEMDRREAALAERSYKQLSEWRERDHDAPPYLVVVVEELADLLMQQPEAETPLIRLAQKGRASGIHLVLATQRPDSVTFSGLLRSNVPSRIGLTVQKASESRIILDDVGAEALLGQGDMLLKLLGEVPRRVHGVWMSAEDIRAVVTAAKK